MQRLYLSDDEKLTRKEYLKRKKKQAKQILKKRSKITYFMIAFLVILSVYLCFQFYIYKQHNNYKYVEGDGISSQRAFNVFYITEGYTYEPVNSLSKVQTDGFGDKTLFQNCGLSDIQVNNNYIYGIKSTGIYRLNKITNKMEMLVEKDVKKYKLYNNYIYYISGDNNSLSFMNTEDNTIKNTDINDVSEMLIDDNNIFIASDKKTKKTLIKYDKQGQNKQDICIDINVSYIIQDAKNIYFVNKNDSNKIYSLSKSGGDPVKVADISSVSDKGPIKEIDGAKYMFVDSNFLYYINVEDGNTLWKINLDTKESMKVISVAVEILQNTESTVFYKIKNEMGVYLFNYNTNFVAQVSKRKIKEFYVDTTSKIDKNSNNLNNLIKN
ncbi:MAG: DUF5050 domain-containing protein [Clostridia bacterium]